MLLDGHRTFRKTGKKISITEFHGFLSMIE